MDMLKGVQIAEADLSDWRKLAQGLHARYVTNDFGAAARFVAEVQADLRRSVEERPATAACPPGPPAAR